MAKPKKFQKKTSLGVVTPVEPTPPPPVVAEVTFDASQMATVREYQEKEKLFLHNLGQLQLQSAALSAEISQMIQGYQDNQTGLRTFVQALIQNSGGDLTQNWNCDLETGKATRKLKKRPMKQSQ